MAGTRVRILLVRHGETVANVEGRWQGQTDSPLTERGLAQARLLAQALEDEPLEAIFSSDLGRALATADVVASLHGLRVEPDVRLRELNVGQWTGRNRDEIQAMHPDQWRLWAERPAMARIPGGETLAAAQQRALTFFDQRMPAHPGQTVLVVTHGAVGQAVLVQAMGRSVEALWLEERLDNCQISRLEWSPEAGLELIELCDTRHLADVGSLRNWRTTDAA